MLCMQPIVLNCIYHPRKLALSRFTIWRFFCFLRTPKTSETTAVTSALFSSISYTGFYWAFHFWYFMRYFWTSVNLEKDHTCLCYCFMMVEFKRPNYYFYQLVIWAAIIECCNSSVSPYHSSKKCQTNKPVFNSTVYLVSLD